MRRDSQSTNNSCSELTEDHSATHTHSPIYPRAHQVLEMTYKIHIGYVMTQAYDELRYDNTTELTMRTTHTYSTQHRRQYTGIKNLNEGGYNYRDGKL